MHKIQQLKRGKEHQRTNLERCSNRRGNLFSSSEFWSHGTLEHGRKSLWRTLKKKLTGRVLPSYPPHNTTKDCSFPCFIVHLLRDFYISSLQYVFSSKCSTCCLQSLQFIHRNCVNRSSGFAHVQLLKGKNTFSICLLVLRKH